MSRTLPIKELQLSFYVDADLAGQTGRHSQECYIALLGGEREFKLLANRFKNDIHIIIIHA